MDQLDLFADTDATPAAPFYFVAVCFFCGDTLDVVEVDDRDVHPWKAAESWCYLAQVEHNRLAHPERVR